MDTPNDQSEQPHQSDAAGTLDRSFTPPNLPAYRPSLCPTSAIANRFTTLSHSHLEGGCHLLLACGC